MPAALQAIIPPFPATGLSPVALDAGAGDAGARPFGRMPPRSTVPAPAVDPTTDCEPGCSQLLAGLRRNLPATYGNPPPTSNS